MLASCWEFLPPKTTDMPTCQRCVADTTQTMLATLPSVGSSDAVSVSCQHYNLPTCRQKTTKSTIVRYDIMQQLMKSPKRPPPWQSRTPGLAAWLLYQQPPTPGYLITMGCLTRHMKDFIQRLKWATKNNSFSIFIILSTLQTRPPPDDRISPPLHSLAVPLPLLSLSCRFRL